MAAFKVFIIRFVIGIGVTVVGFTVLMTILARVVKSPANLGVRDGKLAPLPELSELCIDPGPKTPGIR